MNAETFNLRSSQGRQKLHFDVLEGPRAGESIAVPFPEPGEPPILIGRSRDCLIWIDAQNISRRNTEIFTDRDRRLMVRDMGSVNGTLVNGQLVSQTTPLPVQVGDHIQVGLTRMVFRGVEAPLPPAAPPPPVMVGVATRPGLNVAPQSGPISGPLTQPPAIRASTLPGDYFVYLMMRNGQRYLFDGEEAIVGRGQTNDIVIDSNSISRQHARLQKTVAGVFVQDLGSTNKTFVNGVQADSPVLLRDGDVVRFGDVEADFKLEVQRVTSFNRLVLRPNLADPGAETTFVEAGAEITQRDLQSTDKTLVGGDFEQTFIGDQSGKLPDFLPMARQSQDQSETALDIDIRRVGRQLRQAAALVPDPRADGKSSHRTAPTQEVAHLEGVYLSEGAGRAVDMLLNEVRLGLKPGELVALVGPSGSGKTELLQVMAGLRAADRGQVMVLGRSLPTMEIVGGGQRPNLELDKELGRWRLRSVGYLSGEPEFSPKQSALEHVMWVLEQGGFGRDPRERMDKAVERLQMMGMTDQEVMRLRPGDLNRTERKQLALARALALDPPLLLADEPTGRIHSASADAIFKILKSVTAQGSCVFMVTSDPLWARNADRQIEILDGAIVGSLS